MDLRELTREAERARALEGPSEHRELATRLASEQVDLLDRTHAVVDAILDLPNGREFGQALRNLSNAAMAMDDARVHLEQLTTGPKAVAAETEAIEHLLTTRRGGGGGGGGGSSPGGGTAGEGAELPALALVGRSGETSGLVEEREVSSTTARAGVEPPPELRESLDRYFERLNAK